jgi:murein DD-endopeptidase MepM/ murein hydrolase activator NlpD
LHPRVIRSFFASALAALVGVGTMIPAPPAKAATSEPPFEAVFPQETSKTDFSSTYGAGRSGGRMHKGNDLMAPRMTEVYAIAAGTVYYVGINRLSGRNIKIDHGGGWHSYYLHLNNDNIGTDDGDAPWTLTVAPGVEEGMEVEAGQLIGWVGDSGNAESSSSHTHFELRRDGEAINPYEILRNAFQRDSQREALLAFQLASDFPTYAIDRAPGSAQVIERAYLLDSGD